MTRYVLDRDRQWWSRNLVLMLQSAAATALTVIAIVQVSLVYALLALVYATLAASTWLGTRRRRNQTPD